MVQLFENIDWNLGGNRTLSQSLHSFGGLDNTFADAVFVLLLIFGVESIFSKNC